MPHLYLLHFSRKLAHAGHYLGYTERDVASRVAEHRKGHGSRLVAAAIAAGITVRVTWTKEVDHNGRVEERRIKNCGTLRRLCPICRPAQRRKDSRTRRERRKGKRA